jgi:hypothetical protein
MVDNLQEAITSAKQMDEQSKSRVLSGGFGSCGTAGLAMPALRWEVKRGWILLRFYTDESKSEQHQQTHDLTHVQDIQKGLQQSVQALN